MNKEFTKDDVVVLGQKDLEAILSLQDRVLQSLPEDQDFLFPKQRDEFENIINDNEKCIIGIYDGATLTSLGVIGEPLQDMQKIDLAGFPAPDRMDKLTDISTVMRDPSYSGAQNMLALLGYWTERAQELGRNHAIGIVTRFNVASWTNFFKAGLKIKQVGNDERDGVEVFMLHKNLDQQSCNMCLSQEFAKTAKTGWHKPVFSVSPESPQIFVKALLKLGWQGTQPERDTQGYKPTDRIIFRPCHCA